jgi:uncharacterized LabA/DUF88 family protein
MEKLGLFVDVQNIYYTTRHTYSRQFNYRALWQTLARRGEIAMAFAYATDRGDESQQKFQTALRHIGFTVKLKPYIQRADGSAKGDWDVGITIDVLQNAPVLDRVILLSGDGDFDLLVETVRRDLDTPVEVYGVPTLTADSLKRAADNFHPIAEPLLI